MFMTTKYISRHRQIPRGGGGATSPPAANHRFQGNRISLKEKRCYKTENLSQRALIFLTSAEEGWVHLAPSLSQIPLSDCPGLSGMGQSVLPTF